MTAWIWIGPPPAGSFPVRPIGEAVSRGTRDSTGVVSYDLVLLVFLVFTGPLTTAA